MVIHEPSHPVSKGGVMSNSVLGHIDHASIRVNKHAHCSWNIRGNRCLVLAALAFLPQSFTSHSGYRAIMHFHSSITIECIFPHCCLYVQGSIHKKLLVSTGSERSVVLRLPFSEVSNVTKRNMRINTIKKEN